MNQQTPALVKHLGIIMDGNGRWARKQGLPRISGHAEGVKTTKRIIGAVADRAIPYLSLYVFSTENWSRQEGEISYLMGLLVEHLSGEMPFYRQHQIRLQHAGRRDRLPNSVLDSLEQMVAATAAHQRLVVNLLVDYGGHDEICRAVDRWQQQGQRPCRPQELAACLDGGSELPDVDLLIRSSGEQRLSNFLLWRCAYSELYFSPVLWPAWQEKDLDAALEEFARRQRRYGRES